MNTRRLYRSRYDKQLAGVAGGMADYLELDPTLVRVIWILSVFLGGFTILLYIILAFIVPLAPVAATPGPSWTPGGPTAGWGPGGTWAPAGMPAPGGAPAGTGAAAAGDTEGGAAADTSPTEGWNASQAGWADSAGTAGTAGAAWTGGQGWAAPAPASEPAADRRRGPGAAVYLGVLLVVFGAIALADALIPGLSGVSLAPALLVALGVALMIGSIRRLADEA